MGVEQEKPAVVTGIEVRCIGKYGTEVAEAPWEDVKKHGVVASITVIGHMGIR